MRWIRHPGRALDAYLDGELDHRIAHRVVAHLGRCQSCRRRAALTRHIGRALRATAGQAG